MGSILAILGELLIRQVGLAMNVIFFALPHYLLELGWNLVVGSLRLLFPGSDFGADAAFLHTLGPVAAFMSGCTSGSIFLALIPGFVAGIGLSIAYAQCMEQRSLARRRKAGYVATLASMTLEDLHYLFPRNTFPDWIVFHELERAKWFNHCLKKVWPFFNEAYSRMLMESWEPYLDFYKPAISTSVSFAKLTLGTVAPRFKGVRKLEMAEGEIAFDAEAQWDGNCSCILSVGLPMGIALPAQVKDISMRLVLRFLVKPLVDELPGFQAFTYSIRKKKKFDFTLKFIGGELGAIPGLSGLAIKLQDMIRVAVIDSFCWPMRIVIPIIRDPVDGDFSRYMESGPGISYLFSFGGLLLKPSSKMWHAGTPLMQRHMCPRRNAIAFKESYPQEPAVGVLDIKLVLARDLRRTKTIKNPDGFVLMFIHPIPGLMKRSTTIALNSFRIWGGGPISLHVCNTWPSYEHIPGQFNQPNPVWNEVYELGVEDPAGQNLVIYVLDEGADQEFQVLGCTQIEVKGLEHGVITLRWLKLVKILAHSEHVQETKYRGRIQLELAYRSYDIEERRLRNSAVVTQESAWRQGMGSPPLHNRYSRKGKMWEVKRGVLTVKVLRAENLLPTIFNGKGDPYVVLRMHKTPDHKKETKVVRNNLNPEWNESFFFMVEDAVQDVLMAEIWDKDPFGKDFMGACATTLTRVMEEQELTLTFRLVGVHIGRLSMALKWSSL